MKERSIFNMIISIISASFIIPFIAILIPLKVIEKNILAIIMMSIYSVLLLIYYIFKSIEYGKEDISIKNIFYRLSNVMKDLSLCMIVIYFVLQLTSNLKWLLFSGIVILTILNIVIDGINKIVEYRYLFYGLIETFLLFIIIGIYSWNAITALGIIAIIIDFISNIIGSIIKNKNVLSFDCISLVLFVLFLLLI